MVERKLITNSKAKYPFVTVSLRIYNSDQSDFRTLTQYCWVDTGCSAAIILPIECEAEAMGVGVTLRPKPISLAGKIPQQAKCCLASVVKINDYEFESEIEISATFHGNDSHGLLGLDLINRWISEFDGPKKKLSIYD